MHVVRVIYLWQPLYADRHAGKTPLDLALEMRAQNIIRSFERYALFAGYVNMKVSAGPCYHVGDTCCYLSLVTTTQIEMFLCMLAPLAAVHTFRRMVTRSLCMSGGLL